MKTEMVEKNGVACVIVESEKVEMADAGTALDLMMNIKYEMGCSRIAINKEAIAEEFFILSSGLAGELLQKFINYHSKLAIFGDYSGYTSKALKDFIYESNKGKDIFFVETRQQAIEKLLAAED